MLKKLMDFLAYIWHKVVYTFIGYRDIQLTETNNCNNTTTVAIGMAVGLMLTALAWPIIKFIATSVALLVMMSTFHLIVLFVVITMFYFCIRDVGTIIGYYNHFRYYFLWLRLPKLNCTTHINYSGKRWMAFQHAN